MVKELEERQTEQNIDLGFNSFCEKTKIKNINDLMKVGIFLLNTTL